MFDENPVLPPEESGNDVPPPLPGEDRDDMFGRPSPPVIPPDEDEALTMADIWLMAVTEPKEATYARIIAQPQATLTNAFLWIALAGLLVGFVSGVVNSFNFASLPDMPSDFSSTIFVFLCMTPLMAIAAIISLALSGGLTHWAARLLKGEGEYEKLIFALASSWVPISVVSSFFSLGLLNPILSAVAYAASSALSIYYLVLEVIAVKAVYRFDSWGKAVGAVFLPLIVIVAVLCCCIVAVTVVVLAASSGDFSWVMALI